MALKRMGAATPVQQVEVSTINFGDLSTYSSGGGTPDGDYIWKRLDVKIHQFTKSDGTPAGAARLGVMITAYPVSKPDDPNEKHEMFYSLGSKANESFAPNPETGKGLVTIPGSKGGSLNISTNWALLLKSMYDCGMPRGYFTNDVSVLEGLSVHMQNVEEPEERKGFRSATGEVEGPAQPKKIAIVSEIKDGAPWENLEATTSSAPTNGSTTAKVNRATPAPRPAAPAVSETDDQALMTAAISGISTALEATPAGAPRLAVRTATFKALQKQYGDEMAGAVISNFFETGFEENLANVLGQLGYAVVGAQIKPAA